MDKKMTITEVADIVGVTPKTIMRWEKVGKVRRAKRDFRGWRIYDDEDVSQIREIREAIVEV
ncbi:hypothetical protein MNBD_UNCLBAC01-895 [hydrothermal vent metagenome]|uniref:HTH merR-type domain-containing protein n=1 Tax=hydrothermal vent metagenome TaxID=652676 RepID=A0A3B1DY85_9ZZZZ